MKSRAGLIMRASSTLTDRKNESISSLVLGSPARVLDNLLDNFLFLSLLLSLSKISDIRFCVFWLAL